MSLAWPAGCTMEVYSAVNVAVKLPLVTPGPLITRMVLPSAVPMPVEVKVVIVSVPLTAKGGAGLAAAVTVSAAAARLAAMGKLAHVLLLVDVAGEIWAKGRPQRSARGHRLA